MAAEHAPQQDGGLRLYGTVLANELRGKLSRRGGARNPQNSLPEPGSVPAVEQTVVVREEQNRRFCEVLGQEPGRHAHGGYLHALSFPASTRMMSSQEFPLPLLGAVHLENTMVQHHPVPVGARLRIRSSVSGFGRHRRGVTATVVAQAWDQEGREVFTDTSLYLAKTSGGSGSSSKSGGGQKTEREDPREGFRLIGTWSLGKDAGRRYAAVSGDFNPIHLSGVSAKALGMRTSLIHGMYEASRALGEAADPTAAGTWSIRFGAPAFLPARILIWRKSDAAGSPGRGSSGSGSGEGSVILRGISPKGRQHFEFSYEPAEAAKRG